MTDEKKKRRPTRAFPKGEVRASPVSELETDGGGNREDLAALRGRTLPPPPTGGYHHRPRPTSGVLGRVSFAGDPNDAADVRSFVCSLAAQFPDEAEEIKRSFGVIADIADGKQVEPLVPTALPPPPDGTFSDDRLTNGTIHLSQLFVERIGGDEEKVSEDVPRVVLITMLGMFRAPIIGRVKIGRALDNDVVVEDNPFVSKHHVMIEVVGDRVMICDMNSKNGTLVNGEKLSGVRELTDKDSIFLGDEMRGAKIFFSNPRIDKKNDEQPVAFSVPEKGIEMMDNDKKAPPPLREKPSEIEQELKQRASQIPPPAAADGKMTQEMLPELEPEPEPVPVEPEPAVQSEPEPTPITADSWSFGEEVANDASATGDEDTVPSIPPEPAVSEPEPAPAVVATAETELFSTGDLPPVSEPEPISPPPLPSEPAGRRLETIDFPEEPLSVSDPPKPTVNVGDPRVIKAAAPTKAIPPSDPKPPKKDDKKGPPPPTVGRSIRVVAIGAALIAAVILFILIVKSKSQENTEGVEKAPAVATNAVKPVPGKVVDDKSKTEEPTPTVPVKPSEDNSDVAGDDAVEETVATVAAVAEGEEESLNPLDEETQVKLSRGFRPIDPNSPIAAFIRGEATPRNVKDCMPIGVTLQELDVIRCIEFLPTARQRNAGVFEITKWVLKTQGALD